MMLLAKSVYLKDNSIEALTLGVASDLCCSGGVQQARGLHTTVAQQQATAGAQQQQQGKEKGLAAQEEQFDEITDKHIPVRPVGAVEATSYTVVIVGGNTSVVYTSTCAVLIYQQIDHVQA